VFLTGVGDDLTGVGVDLTGVGDCGVVFTSDFG